MKITRTVLLTAFAGLFLAPPALAAGASDKAAGVQPCDAEALDGYYEWAAFHEDKNYFPEDEQAAPDEDDQATPADEIRDPSADDGEEGEEAAPDGEGCADITLAPYDMLLNPLTDGPKLQAVDVRRRVPAPAQKPEYI